MLNFNGNIISAKNSIFTAENRAFRYGDGVFETIRVFDNKIPFLNLHKQRLLSGMKALKMNIPKTWKTDFIDKEINKLLQYKQNKQNINSKKGNLRLRLAVFRTSGGFYTPISNEVEFCIEVSELSENNFTLNNIGLVCGIFEELPISPNKISAFKTSNSLPYILAGLYRKEQKTDDCFIINSSGHICETVAANIFGVTQDNQLITPPISEGCIDGIMRKVVLKTAQNLQLSCVEKPILIDNLREFKEIFITNAIQGITWVSGCKPLEKYDYTNKVSQKLVDCLTKKI
jgi:branched-chain amino acid aminotransferase